jgi:hypothetical protein
MLMRYASCAFLTFSLLSSAQAADYQSRLKGRRLILEGANSSGMQFKGVTSVVFFAEITGENPICEARVRWLSRNLIYMSENGRTSEGCAPRTWLYRVENFEGSKITLREFNNTWPSSSDSVFSYTIVPKTRNIE